MSDIPEPLAEGDYDYMTRSGTIGLNERILLKAAARLRYLEAGRAVVEVARADLSALLARSASMRHLLADSANDDESFGHVSSANFKRSVLTIVAGLETQLRERGQ